MLIYGFSAGWNCLLHWFPPSAWLKESGLDFLSCWHCPSTDERYCPPLLPSTCTLICICSNQCPSTQTVSFMGLYPQHSWAALPWVQDPRAPSQGPFEGFASKPRAQYSWPLNNARVRAADPSPDENSHITFDSPRTQLRVSSQPTLDQKLYQ